MLKYENLNIKLQALTVFRDILGEELIIKLRRLFACDDRDKESLIDLYCDFVHELYKTTENFSRWVLKYISEDENVYVKRIIEGKEPGELMAASLENELGILEELARVNCDDMIFRIGMGLHLPRWKTEDLDLRGVYEKRLEEIPTKGYGIFARYHMFTAGENGLVPVRRPDPQTLDSLYGYETEREKVLKNTQALVESRPANNILLYGDAGTGKSSTVKAVANAFKNRGVRLIEVKKNQLYLLPGIMDSLEGSPLKYIIFIDDLSFNSGDGDFAALKAILEGSVGSRGNNIVVYATSNRRHLIKENSSDRDGSDVHLSDTLQEQQSLSARFGLTITFIKPEKELYCDIVTRLADEYGLETDRDALLIKAEAHAIRNGGRSPRTAKQFVEMMKSGVIK